MSNKIKVIITGATGMVGEGVLHECLLHPDVEAVLVAGRKPCGVSHPKLSEVIIPDFFDLSSAESRLQGYDACFFCMGVSSVGMNSEEYYKVTYTLTMNFATILSKNNSGMTFCYVSGAGTDGTEQGWLKWARVKGKTENDLTRLPFRAVYNFRPAFMLPTPGLKNTLPYYKYVNWLYPVVRPLFPGSFGTLKELGLAMIHLVLYGYEKRVLDPLDIRKISEKKL
jgi:uncharacterized protein YbjT (DUF2867 family)